MQDGIDFITALARHPETARRLARKLWNFFVSELEAPDPAFVESVASEYLRSGTEMKPVVRYILRSEWFTNPDRLVRALFVAGGVRGPRDSGDRLGGLFGRHRAHAADEHGADAVRAARRQRMGARARMVFDRRDARPHEFRVDAGGESAVQPVARSTTSYRSTPETLLDFFLFERLSPAPFDRQPVQRAALVSENRAGRGRAPTRRSTQRRPGSSG